MTDAEIENMTVGLLAVIEACKDELGASAVDCMAAFTAAFNEVYQGEAEAWPRAATEEEFAEAEAQFAEKH